jgi:GNAT superfamily N-acetyltransferase
MHLLNQQSYHLLSEPLKRLSINTLFARAVIEHKVTGSIYVDHIRSPASFYVMHPYGMSLLFGCTDKDSFNQRFAEYALNRNGSRTTNEWMQAWPGDWDATLQTLLAGHLVPLAEQDPVPDHKIEVSTRVNFRFNRRKYEAFKQEHLIEAFEVVRTNEDSFRNMQGTVIPSNFWDSAEDFCSHGVGYSLYHDGELATTAYSAYLFEGELELGMETVPAFRGRGFAQYTCAALIDYCLERGYEPIWACKMENVPSYRLAQKLGFEPTVTLPYYRLAL